MNVNIYYIQKKLDSSELASKYHKLLAPLIKLAEHNVFNKQIAACSNATAAQSAYSEAFESKLASGYNIALSEDGAQINSVKFAALLADKASVNFFIGGAYGLESCFKKRCDYVLSLSALTTTHELARVFLLEQIYRGLCINSNHPYHK